MQRLAEYLENVRRFERLAADETNPQIRAQFEEQAASYRKLAERREKFLRRCSVKFQTEPGIETSELAELASNPDKVGS
jgi:hypothetical protein